MVLLSSSVTIARSWLALRALFAVYLRTNVRTLENWEQRRAKPNAQAALLINLVKLFPGGCARQPLSFGSAGILEPVHHTAES
jgi:putative transcriptional regulator